MIIPSKLKVIKPISKGLYVQHFFYNLSLISLVSCNFRDEQNLGADSHLFTKTYLYLLETQISSV